jgi:hypothetical protein
MYDFICVRGNGIPTNETAAAWIRDVSIFYVGAGFCLASLVSRACRGLHARRLTAQRVWR